MHPPPIIASPMNSPVHGTHPTFSTGSTERRSAATHGECGGAADHAGLRRVRIDDIGL